MKFASNDAENGNEVGAEIEKELGYPANIVK